MVDETLLLLANPEGFENQLRANACWPLIDRPGIMFDYAQLETGIFSYLSPVYVHQGAYVAVSPLSVLTVRADLAGLVIWPLPLDGAGYFELPGYQRDLSAVAFPASAARASHGVNGTLSVNLQGAVPLSGWLDLIVTDTFAADWFWVNGGAFYLNQRRDVVLRRSDVLLKNTAFLLFDFKVGRGVSLRAGAVDDLTFVPGSGEVQNIVSGFFSVPIRREGELRDLEPYVRAGGYTAHGWRRGFFVMLGISLAWAYPLSSPME